MESKSTTQQIAEQIQKANNILVLVGAGISCSAGIPDYRSPNGIFSRMPNFEKTFRLDEFEKNPALFYELAPHILPTNASPTPTHKFLRLLEEKQKLTRVYTQNFDTLEIKAGIKRVFFCHGSVDTATCYTSSCGAKFPGTAWANAVRTQKIPLCPFCHSSKSVIPMDQCVQYPEAYGEVSSSPSFGVLRPDIIFYGEPLPSSYRDSLREDHRNADLLIVMGTSLKVPPVSDIPKEFAHIPTILINKTDVEQSFDYKLFQDSDSAVMEICDRLGWNN